MPNARLDSLIAAPSKRTWKNPLDPQAVDKVLKKVKVKNGLYNGYLGAMRLALELMTRMMADPDPVIAQAAALNLMRSDGYSGLIGLPAIKTALRHIKDNMQKMEQEQLKKELREKTEKKEWPGDKPAPENVIDPLTRQLAAQLAEQTGSLGEEEEDGTGSDQT